MTKLCVVVLSATALTACGACRDPGDNAHSVAVDRPTHRVFFALISGPNGKPVMHIMRPDLAASPAPSGT